MPEVRTRYYKQISKPVLVVFDNDPERKIDMLPLVLRENPNWKAVRSSHTRGMPQFENPGETFRNIETFWKQYE